MPQQHVEQINTWSLNLLPGWGIGHGSLRLDIQAVTAGLGIRACRVGELVGDAQVGHSGCYFMGTVGWLGTFSGQVRSFRSYCIVGMRHGCGGWVGDIQVEVASGGPSTFILPLSTY